MSGGRFDYAQYRIQQIADDIERELEKQGQETEVEIWEREYYPNGKFYETYSPEIQKHFKDAIETLKKAYIYAHRIDYFLSGDDDQQSFLRRLNKELINLNHE
jgi:hypothetical protein